MTAEFAPAPVCVERSSSFAIDVSAALLESARRGEHTAFEELFRRFERPVFTLGLRLCGNREDAADVLQDTMLKVFGGVASFRGGSPFWGWLRQVAVNEALQKLRRRRMLVDELPMGEHDAEDTGPPPAAAAEAAALARALLRLPPLTRSVLWLFHAEGYTHDEIAGLMQKTPSFSKSQLARGGRRLRALLETPEEIDRG